MYLGNLQPPRFYKDKLAVVDPGFLVGEPTPTVYEA